MPEAWSHWEGHVVNGKFHLKKYLGGSEQSAVFLTNRPEHELEPGVPGARGFRELGLEAGVPGARGFREVGWEAATIKLIASDPANAELQLARWRKAQGLSHPNLVRIFDFGRCHLGGRDLIFAVMEHAEESLAQILSERPLTAQEARQMLAPILDALACLHVQGFVLGSLKPGNVLATNDQLKLSSDGIGRAGETASHLEQPVVYDPPELAGGRRSPAADVWSLGMTLAQVLTQHLPAWNEEDQADPALPENLPAPFQEIVRGCLRRDAKSRFTVADIAERLYAQPPKPQPRAADAKPLPKPPAVSSRGKPWVWRYAFPLALAVVGVAALLAGFGFLRHQPATQPAAAAVKPEPKPDLPKRDAGHASPETPSLTKPKPGQQLRSAGNRVAPPMNPQPASMRSEVRSEVRAAAGNLSPAGRNSARDGDVGAGVVQQVLPNVAQSASDTIQGTIKVSVRANVDPSGTVAGADLVSAGPSKYFARLALEAAPKWKFAPSSQNAGREFLLHFEFRNSGTRAFATR
jgi:TonB family protein